MRICLVGKFPPIEGGVSARTYRIAHGLARRGHEVHVVTNAREVEAEFRVYMRDVDWDRCEAVYPSGGRVVVHWTSLRSGHSHIPMDPAFVTRLASTAATVAREIDAHCIFSFYLEPYGVAGHLAASITGKPHLVRLAGSDRDRLWAQPDMQPVYDAVLQQAAAVFTGGALARRLLACGVAAERLQQIAAVIVSTEEFCAEGDTFAEEDLAALAAAAGSRMWSESPSLKIGIYGKLDPHKGTSVLLQALRRLRDRGLSVGLIVTGDGYSATTLHFDGEVDALGLGDSVLRLPFVPPWRVPAFLRTCDVVTSLEQDFPVRGHAPAIFSEGMAAGRCVVASTEVALKQPNAERLVHGYNCFLLRDAHDPGALAGVLEEALRADRDAIGRRARRFAEATYSASEVLDDVESGLRRAVEGKGEDRGERDALEKTRSTLRRLLRTVLDPADRATPPAEGDSANWFARRLQAAPPPPNAAVRDALRFGAQLSASLTPEKRLALCFRSGHGAAAGEPELLGSVPALCPAVSFEEYSHDFEEWLRDGQAGLPSPGPCAVAAVPAWPPRIVFVDRQLMTVLQSCDGQRTVAEVAREVAQAFPALDAAVTVRQLFEDGLLELR